MDHTIAEEYKSSLNDLNFNSKPLINMLTMLADENKKHASLIVNTIVNHINSASPESKLPGLYLVDSIIKNLGDQYLKIFCQHIIPLFTSVFEKVDENTRSLMFKLRQTWTDILPNKVLYNLDVSVEKLDPAWPVTAKNPSTKKILINPKFLEGSVEEKKIPQFPRTDVSTGEVPTSTLKKEEDKIKQRQGEVLKELLAKQEQLRRLEIKKLQLTMKKKSATIGSSSHITPTSTNSFKQNPIRDPRMVKINNVPQTVSVVKAGTNSASQGNPASDLSTTSTAGGFPGGRKATIHAKAQVQSNSNNSKNNVAVENPGNPSNSKDSVHTTVAHKKGVPKSKSDKWTTNKHKYNTLSKDKAHQDVKSSSTEGASNSFKVEESCTRNEGSSTKANEKTFKPTNKVFKASPKKKSGASENVSKMSLTSAGPPSGFNNKKLPLLKIPKKSDKLKSVNSEALTSIGNKVNINNEKTGNESDKKKKDLILPLHQAIDKSKSVGKAKDSSESVVNAVKSESHIQCISQKDEDLRIHSVPLNEEAPVRVPKRDITESDPSSNEADKTQPNKKPRNDDIENLSPDFRTHSPVLFGAEDQDLRQPDVNSKDWSQYKATHPDECSPILNRQDSSEGRFKFRKYQFPDFKHHYPSEQDRYASGRHQRGRYVSRGRNVARFARFQRGGRGRFSHTPPDVMLDSQNYLQRAEERFRLGKISESDYMDIRRGLQKMVQSFEYKSLKNRLSKLQDHGHQSHQSHNVDEPEYDHKKNFQGENLKIQGPSAVPHAVKPFVLDGKEKFIHFVEDRALVLMDDNEPRELTFKDEHRKVFIEGVAEPLALGFDGKSVEFEVDGRRHIIRFGVPGRELYINNHPYEAQFGGPPIAAMLADGCVYKLRLSGPPPQVIIGNKPQYELFSRYHGNINKAPPGSTFTPGPNYANEEQKLQTEYSTPSSGAFLQDIDMRQKPENMNQSEGLMGSQDSPFYVQDMKDVDWRHMPLSSDQETEKSHPNVFRETVSETFDSWPDEDNVSRMAFVDERNNQHALQESSKYDWETPVSRHQTEVQSENKDLAPSTSQDSWYYNQQDKSNWRNNDYNRNSHFAPPPEKRPRYQGPCNADQNFGDQMEHYDSRNNQFQKFGQYSRRPSYPNRRMRGRAAGPSYGPWMPKADRGPRHDSHHNQPPTNFPAVPSKSKALLPSPPFPPDYPTTSHTSSMPPPLDKPIPPAAVYDESSSGVPSQLASSDVDAKPTESNSSDLNVNVESLLEKLIAAGIINVKPEQPVATPSETAPVSETSDTDAKKDSEPPAEEIPEIEFTPESLRVHHAGVLSALHKGLQCATCGMRFKEMQSDHYSRHLDWHFRMNRREKDGAKKAISRRWHYEVDDWIQFEEFEDFEERVPSYFELQADNQHTDVPEVPTVISVPATSDDEEACPVCSERFQLFWVEDEEEWHYRDAVRHDNVTYHPACYEDFKKAAKTERAATNLEISDTDDVDSEVTDLLKSLLDEVCEIAELESEAEKSETERLETEKLETEKSETEKSETESPSEVDLNTSETVEKVPSETHFEEEILEGKPGEEEIIGVISESDMEVENNIPKTESKMVVMQSGGITLKVKAESLQCHSPSNPSEKDTKQDDEKAVDDEIDFRPPTPDPNFEVRPPVSKGRELSGLCCIM